ncbi:MAG: tetratricopeptide repeat protein [Nostocales cyanobacterium 94392]|nr:tetratricopeptide repeat protein [Nostocales cyanobacterium 94392]
MSEELEESKGQEEDSFSPSPHPPIPPSSHPSNEEGLEELAWSLEASRGEFKLILARCNYLRLRSRLVKRLRKLTDVDIRILNLKRTDKTLYGTIAEEVKDNPPDALMVFYLESVHNLKQMLSAANQVREEFRKQFHFPVILWVTDDVLPQLVRSASDFESWATTTEFAIATNELTATLKEDTDALFATALAADAYCLGWQMGYLRRREVITALQDLKGRGYELAPALKASVEFVLGQDAYLTNKMEQALEHYHQSLTFWQSSIDISRLSIKEAKVYSPTPPPSSLANSKFRMGIILFYIGLCYFQQAQRYRLKSLDFLQAAKQYFQQSIDIFTQANHPNLVAKFINPLGEVLQRLENWKELKNIAQKSLDLQQLYGNSLRVAQAYGFLAEVASSQNQWTKAKQYAYQALHNIAKAPSGQLQHRALYLLLLANAERHLKQESRAIKHLQMARDIGSQDNPHQYIRILQILREVYWEEYRYLEAFRVKLEQRSIEQQYGFRAFIGAGIIQPQRQAKLIVETLHTTSIQAASVLETVAPEMTASGRGRDVEKLLEKIARPDCKMVVVHGYSGVGKSSLVQAGLVPAFKHSSIGLQEIVPILVRTYTNWIYELGKRLIEALKSKGIQFGIDGEPGKKVYHFPYYNPESPEVILELLRQSEWHNLRIVLIFDQFEEFFFVYNSAAQRRQFFEFMGECLNILSIKVILSLREDYLHYLLECNRLSSMKIINNDILSKNILYKLDNFASSDAKSLIERLTQHSNFHLEPGLIEQLVQDLSAKYGEVRPIELQVVGAQLQTENITKLIQYNNCGLKEELVKRYMKEVVEDCGEINRQVAELLLYLLTDEKGTRPLKTRSELERDLRALSLEDLSKETNQLDLVLRIFVEAGIVVLIPENPADRYQLVHDYLASFIQKQQKPRINELIAELKKERNKRILSEDKLNRIYQKVLLAALITLGVFTLCTAIAIGFVWE